MLMKILHTSDIHLGAKASFLKAKAGEFRQQLVMSFESLHDKAIAQKVNLVIIAGDLFHSSNPSKTNIGIVRQVLKKLADAGIYTVIIPGNHDPLVQGSVYLSEDFSVNDKVIVFNDPKLTQINIDPLEVTIFARANTSATSVESPLKELRTRDAGLETKDPLPEVKLDEIAGGEGRKDYLEVAVAHGSMDIAKQSSDSYPITKEEIANSGFDYIALGDWHSTLDVSSGGVTAYYSGSIEPLAVDQKSAGSVVVVELEKGQEPKVEIVRIGRFWIKEIEIHPEKSKKSLLELIESKTKELLKEEEIEAGDLILRVNLTGPYEIGQVIETEELNQYFETRFFHFRLQNNLELDVAKLELSKYPSETIIGKYIEFMREKLKKGEIDEDVVEGALNRGVRKLTSTT